VQVTLAWEMLRTTPADFKTFVHILGPAQADGSPLYAQLDAQPCDNAYPTWQWAQGEILIDRVSINLPESVKPGTFQLSVGWYDAVTLQRLAATDDTGLSLGDSVALQVIRVEAP